MKQLLLSFACLLAMPLFAQKTVYIPLYIQDTSTVEGGQFTWDKTAQSDNFIMIWGNTVGTAPASYTADASLAFNPQTILNTMEMLYDNFKDLGFLDDSAGTNLAQYKIPIIMYGTYGPDVVQGFANGGDVDGVIGAFWVHPIAMQTGDVAAHELVHSLQAQCVIDYRNTNGLGPVWNNAGIFWETHANFMRNLIYPQDVTAWGMDVYHIETWGDWKNTYENYPLLFAIMDAEGINMVNRLWRESLSNEYPIAAYKRLGNYTQEQFNTVMYSHVRRMATFDFEYNNLGNYLREYRAADQLNYLPTVQAAYNVLTKVEGAENRYAIPVEQAPEEYSYNMIPLHVDAGVCSVIVKFKGHTDANIHAGWRYGFVTAHPDGTVSRYSDTYSANTAEIAFALEGDETTMYLMVMGAPFNDTTTNATNDTWHGYPKHFRFPYELTITGAVPEGFQEPANFRTQLKSEGAVHANGGGWIAASASVAASVYVSPAAMVLGNAQITGNVRLENTALVKDAVISGSVKVLNNAFVNGGAYSGNAIIQGQAFVENAVMTGNALVGMRARVTNYNLSGTVEVGGDVVVYNSEGSCDNGVYYKLTNFYEDNLLACDGRTADHPENSDVNSTYMQFTAQQMEILCNCETLPNCLALAATNNFVTDNTVLIYPNPAANEFTVNATGEINSLKLYNAVGAVVNVVVKQSSKGFTINSSSLANGVYLVEVVSNNKKQWVRVAIAHN